MKKKVVEHHFDSFGEIKQFMKRNAPDWEIRECKDYNRVFGKKKIDCMKLYAPGKRHTPFAVFYKGFFPSNPDLLTGHYGPIYGAYRIHYSMFGSLGFAMDEVIRKIEADKKEEKEDKIA